MKWVSARFRVRVDENKSLKNETIMISQKNVTNFLKLIVKIDYSEKNADMLILSSCSLKAIFEPISK